MTNPVIPDLWPFDIAPTTVLPPEQILRHQAGLIGQKTAGAIVGEILSEEKEGRKMLSFFLVSAEPAKYRLKLFHCAHSQVLPYQLAFTRVN